MKLFRNTIRSWRPVLPVVGLMILLLVTGRLLWAEGDPTAIDLDSFTGEGMDNAIRILWSTETEFGVSGYRIKRGTSETGTFAIITVTFEGSDHTFIPAQAFNPSDGADYDVVDELPTNGQTFWYKLVEIHEDSSESEYGPIQVTAGEVTPTPTPTPFVLGGTPTPSPTPQSTGNSGGGTATATATVPAGSTATATATANASGTTVATATATALATHSATATSTGGPFVLPSSTATNAAVAQTNPTPDEAYPPPDSVEETVATPDAYPGAGADDAYPGAPSVEDDAPGNSMEATTQNPNEAAPDTPGGQPATIGGGTSDSLPPPDGSGSSDRPASAVRGSLIMWIGFIAAVLIFCAGLFGSIILFSRQRARDDQ